MKCCDMRAGMLRVPVLFEAPTNTANGTGGYTEVWATVSGAPTYAHVEEVSGDEVFNSDRVEATHRLKIVCRYSAAVNEKQRVTVRGKIYNIRNVRNMEFRDKWLSIMVDGGARGIATVSAYDVYVPVGSDSYLTSEGDTYTVIAA